MEDTASTVVTNTTVINSDVLGAYPVQTPVDLNSKIPEPPKPIGRLGEIFEMLRSAGEQGVESSVLGSKSAAWSSIMRIRKAGFKIDYVDGRYLFSGVGKSTVKMAKNLRSFSVKSGRAKRRVLKVAPKVKVQADPPAKTEDTDVFVIHLERFQKALAILPEDVRMGLMEISRKTQNYNRVIRFYVNAFHKKNQILAGL